MSVLRKSGRAPALQDDPAGRVGGGLRHRDRRRTPERDRKVISAPRDVLRGDPAHGPPEQRRGDRAGVSAGGHEKQVEGSKLAGRFQLSPCSKQNASYSVSSWTCRASSEAAPSRSLRSSSAFRSALSSAAARRAWM